MAAMNTPATHKKGANDANCYTAEGVGDALVPFYTSLTRKAGEEFIKTSIKAVIKQRESKGFTHTFEERVRDLWLLTFQTRDVRGGKGERDLFVEMFDAMTKAHHNSINEALAMLHLIPEYGSWLDMIKVLLKSDVPAIRNRAFTLMVMRFNEDRAILRRRQHAARTDVPQVGGAAVAAKSENISLLAKWLPREGAGKFAKNKLGGKELAEVFADAIYPQVKNRLGRLRMYRKHCAELNRELKTVEVPMCGGSWATIKPDAVPGRALKLYRNAFMNKDRHGKLRSGAADRVACAENFRAHLEKVVAGKATVKGGDVVYPHEIVRNMLRSSTRYTMNTTDSQMNDEEKLLAAQWESVKARVVSAAGEGKSLASCVPMCDFSGSMSGIPMEVSMALGILLSEVNAPAFRGGMLTFDSHPQWLQFREGASLKEKIYVASRAGQGLSTNFEAALKMVLDRMVKHKVPVGEEPENIVVFTDMGFDAAARDDTGIWETIVEKFQREFKAAGGWKMPKIVIWNLRAEYKDYHAKADREGVVMLSGWSPSAMKVLTEGVSVKTPYEGVRAILDDSRYDRVRAALESFRSTGEVPAPKAV